MTAERKAELTDEERIIFHPVSEVAGAELSSLNYFSLGPHSFALSGTLLRGVFMSLTGFVEQKCRLLGFMLLRDDYLRVKYSADLPQATMSSLKDKNSLFVELQQRFLSRAGAAQLEQVLSYEYFTQTARKETVRLSALGLKELYPTQYRNFELLSELKQPLPHFQVPGPKEKKTDGNDKKNKGAGGQNGSFIQPHLAQLPCGENKSPNLTTALSTYLEAVVLNENVLRHLLPDLKNINSCNLLYLYQAMYRVRNETAHNGRVATAWSMTFQEITSGHCNFNSFFFLLYILIFTDLLFTRLYGAFRELGDDDFI